MGDSSWARILTSSFAYFIYGCIFAVLVATFQQEIRSLIFSKPADSLRSKRLNLLNSRIRMLTEHGGDFAYLSFFAVRSCMRAFVVFSITVLAVILCYTAHYTWVSHEFWILAIPIERISRYAIMGATLGMSATLGFVFRAIEDINAMAHPEAALATLEKRVAALQPGSTT